MSTGADCIRLTGGLLKTVKINPEGKRDTCDLWRMRENDRIKQSVPCLHRSIAEIVRTSVQVLRRINEAAGAKMQGLVRRAKGRMQVDLVSATHGAGILCLS